LVHDLRRTAARTMIPEKQIMLIAGWKTRSMFDRYHIVDERDIQEAGKKLARHLAQQECVVKEGTKEGTGEWSAEVSGIGQSESIQ